QTLSEQEKLTAVRQVLEGALSPVAIADFLRLLRDSEARPPRTTLPDPGDLLADVPTAISLEDLGQADGKTFSSTVTPLELEDLYRRSQLDSDSLTEIRLLLGS